MKLPIRTSVKDLAELRHVVEGPKGPRAVHRFTRTYERRYHASWLRTHGPSPLAQLREWLSVQRGTLAEAPRDLLIAAEANVASRLPGVAAREPTRRHRKHFAWLLGWQLRLVSAINVARSEAR